jgi:hypothetical protein
MKAFPQRSSNPDSPGKQRGTHEQKRSEKPDHSRKQPLRSHDQISQHGKQRK